MVSHRLEGLSNEAMDPVHELGYSVKRSGLYMLGKSTADSIGKVVAETIPQQMAGISASMAGTVGGVVMIGASAAVSATLTQMDYVHRKENIKDFYKEELAARLNKPLDKVTADDLYTLGKENRVIGEEMHQIRKQRNFGVGISFLASLAALAVVTFALPAVVALVAGAGTTVASLGVGGTLLKLGAALISYNIVKGPLHHVADKLFDLDYKTTHDHIVNLSKERQAGRAITQEQIVGVYAAASPNLDRAIKREHGKFYDELTEAQQAAVTKELSKQLPLEKLVNDVNSGRVNVTEIAFSVEGQMSGVDHTLSTQAPKKGLLTSLVKGIQNTIRPPQPTEQDAQIHDHIRNRARAEQPVIPLQPEANRVAHVQ
ncbi:MAG: hypothetical protein K2Q01_04520, partial [Rickettsiales bacterium]|nr:hypothetical protein [Rickettsiales bacterium]